MPLVQIKLLVIPALQIELIKNAFAHQVFLICNNQIALNAHMNAKPAITIKNIAKLVVMKIELIHLSAIAKMDSSI